MSVADSKPESLWLFQPLAAKFRTLWTFIFLLNPLELVWRLVTAPFRVLPDVYIVGEVRCGTTTLAAHLKSLPGAHEPFVPWIHPLGDKETFYFSGHYWGLIHPYFYRMCFPLKLTAFFHRRVLQRPFFCYDACAQYLTAPWVPALLHKVTPNARILVCVRDPVQQNLSWWRYEQGAMAWGNSLELGPCDGGGSLAAVRLRYPPNGVPLPDCTQKRAVMSVLPGGMVRDCTQKRAVMSVLPGGMVCDCAQKRAVMSVLPGVASWARGSYGQPTEKDAGTQTDIAVVRAPLEDRIDRRDWSHPVFVPCKCKFECPYWDPRQRGEGGNRRMSSPEVTRTLDQYRRAAVWCTKTGIAAVEKLLVLAHPSRPTTKSEVLEDRKDMLIEFQRLEEAIVGDMLRDLEGPTDDLVEVGLLETDRRVVCGEWPLGEPGGRHLRTGEASPNGSGSPGSSGPSPRGVLRTEDEVQRMVDAAVAAALAGRGPIGQGGSSKERDPPVSLREVARASAGKRRGWSWTECERVITEIMVAAARQAAELARVKHSFGRHPARRVKPWEFELVDNKFPACKQEQCGLEELQERAKVRTKHLHAYIDLALRELADMQRALAGVPGIEQPVFDEEWAAAAAVSRKRRAVRQPSGSDGEDSESEEKKRTAAKARFGSLRTATDEELRRALDGSLAVKDITRPPGARPFLPAGGALKGMDIRVSRPGGDYEEGGAEWRLDAKRGMVLEAKAKHCRSFDEWDETFTVLACKAPEDARDLLLQFRKWMRLMSIDYSWDHLRKFYDHLCVRMEKEASTTFELVSYTAHWEMYKRDKGIKEKGYGGGGGGGSSSWSAGGTGSRYPKKPRVSDPEQPDAGVVKPDKPGKRRGADKRSQSACFDHNSQAGCGRKACSPGEATPPGEPEGGGGAQGAPEGEIVVEPEEEREDGVTMASGDQEPEPAGEACEMQVEDAGPWWARLRRLLVAPVWDATGAPLPAAPAAAPAVSPAGTRCGEHYPAVAESRSARWPASRAAIVEGARVRGLFGTGTTEEERTRFQQEVRDVGAQVPLMSERAHLLAEALKDWPDVAFLVRGAACGVGFPFAGEEPDAPYIVENYVGDEHAEAMTAELAKEMAAGRIFDARDWLPRGVSALGMVERLRKGKLKYRPVWDYSRPSFVGVNDWIDLQKDEFSSVKDAYALLRPGMYMVKVDLEEAYRSLPVASQYWAAQCFQWRGKRYMDTRSPFGNRALPGIFMRYTRAIVAWMQAQGVPCVGYLDGLRLRAEASGDVSVARWYMVRDCTQKRAVMSVLPGGMVCDCAQKRAVMSEASGDVSVARWYGLRLQRRGGDVSVARYYMVGDCAQAAVMSVLPGEMAVMSVLPGGMVGDCGAKAAVMSVLPGGMVSDCAQADVMAVLPGGMVCDCAQKRAVMSVLPGGMVCDYAQKQAVMSVLPGGMVRDYARRNGSDVSVARWYGLRLRAKAAVMAVLPGDLGEAFQLSQSKEVAEMYRRAERLAGRWRLPDWAITWPNGQLSSFTQNGRFMDNIERYLRYFDRSQIEVIEVMEQKYDIRGVMKKLTSLLPIHDKLEMTTNLLQMNPSSKLQADQEPTKECMDMIAAYYKPHNERLYRFLGRKFAWSCGLQS
ncbi:hypothetical protein CYMTET_47639 [Cymbomonas tetramitiformis]|uniref:Sulfotransferase n=1 Tax=Cymbomonas tetramitiformis TaxID=36881 RepID=A0AAE0EWI2_9CHLO|nr:hypothetical protein CYMTET_47639 [Cymbomonas tetramitiformis]